MVERPRLLELLDGVATRPLTTLTAPAGYGKSALAAQWCRQRALLPVAWLRLGREDKSPEQLLRRTLAAMSDLGRVDLADDEMRLSADHSRLDDGSLDRLVKIAEGFGDAVLVVDGLRASGPIGLYADVATALEQAEGCGLHILAISRCLPPPTMIALQLRGGVAHVTAEDLRLDAAETAAVVHAYSQRPLAASTAADLAERLDGWMAGTVVTAMSRPRGEATVEDLLGAAMDGIDGYFQSEVIDPLPERLRSFLTQTSGVAELTGPLCNRLIGEAGGEETLETMRRHGLPVFRGAGGRYRYQSPFRAVLDARARREDPEARDAALRRAAQWHVDDRRPFDAADIYAQLGDWDAVGEVVMTHAKEIIENDQIGRAAALVAKAPPAVLRQHTGWAVAAAAFLMSEGRVAAANETLHFYEAHFGAAELMVADLIRGDSVAWVADMAAPLGAADAALAAADVLGDGHRYSDLYGGPPSTTAYYRLSAHCKAVLGCAFAGWWERGARHLVDIPPDLAGTLPHIRHIQFRGERAVFLALAGEAAAARAEAERALAVAAEALMTDNRQAAAAYWALGEAFRLSGSPERAREPLEQALALARSNGRSNVIAGVIAAQVHLLVDGGDAARAAALVESHRAETAHRPPLTIEASLVAAEARALAATGQVLRALEILERAPVTSATAATAVRLALDVGERSRARSVLDDWPRERTPLGTVRRSLSVAMVQQLSGSTTEAVSAVRGALATASRAGLLQPVAEWGVAVVRPLRRIARGDTRSHVAALARRAEVLIDAGGSAAPRFTAQQAAVLAHLGRGLSVPAIAAEMYLSVNTVKTYVKAIYRKLGVTSRSEALAIWRSSLQTGGAASGPTDD